MCLHFSFVLPFIKSPLLFLFYSFLILDSFAHSFSVLSPLSFHSFHVFVYHLNFVIQVFFFIAILNVTFYLPLCDIISAYGSDLCGTVDKICYINASVCSGIGVHDDNLIEKLVATQYFCGLLPSDTHVNYNDSDDNDDGDDNNVNGGDGGSGGVVVMVLIAITLLSKQ